MVDPAKNFAKVTVSIPYDNTATSILLNTGESSKLPNPATEGAFNLVWWNSTDYSDPADDPNKEIVRCTTISTDTLTITRAQEATTATNKNVVGKTYKMMLTITAKWIPDLQFDAQSRVDTHSALISSIHNFDTLGNAPPQIHGNAKHDSNTVDGGAALSSAMQIPLHGSAQHTGTIGNWTQIDKTTSNISDITTRSHTSLTDIGTRTHPQIDSQIDSHIGATTSVHNFDVLGNAPPQTHGKIKHDVTTVDGGASLLSASQIPTHGSAQHTGIIGTESELTFVTTNGHTHDGTNSTKVPWANIDKITSNISDITTRSHTTLTDIGTSTHPQIDTHISSYTNIHGISAGLDASKPSSPIVGQKYIAVDTNKDYECYVAGTWRDITSTHAALISSVHNFDASGNAPPQVHTLASHTGIIGDHQGNLSGIGSNTHTQIDSHIGATASVHNFDTLGNAPPQTHGKTKHDSTTVDGGAVLSSVTQIPLHGSSQHTGTIGTWTQIDKTASNISDITTRSHGSLTDGIIPGTTNSHTAIDTHITSTTGVHGISAGLDASKPASPVVGQRYIATDTNKDYECYVAGTWRDVTSTHAALTSSVHNFDSSGNAPPQTHGKTKHDATTVDGGAALSSVTQIPAHGSTQHTGIIGDHASSLTSIGTNSHATIDSHISSTSVHGASSAIVGINDSQTLTNKTIKGIVGIQLPVGTNKWV